MKNRLNLLAAALVLGLISTGYGACYLQKWALCVGNGDQAFSSVKNCGGYTATFIVYANQNAWKWDVYSVTKGGFVSNGGNTYCSTEASIPDLNNGFDVYYVDPCTGGTVTAHNGQGAAFQVQYPTAQADFNQTCN